MGVAKERVFRRNTVAGSRKGQKWPEKTRTAALCDLLVSNNLCAVARRYGVPESTLRGWLTAARRAGSEGEASLFEKARAEQLRAVGHLAAAGALASVEYARRRLESNDRDAALYEEMRKRLDEADGLGGPGGPAQDGSGAGTPDGAARGGLDEEARRRLAAAMERHRPMSDLAATAYIRTLTGTAGRAAQLLEEDRRRKADADGDGGRIVFALGEELDGLGG